MSTLDPETVEARSLFRTKFEKLRRSSAGAWPRRPFVAIAVSACVLTLLACGPDGSSSEGVAEVPELASGADSRLASSAEFEAVRVGVEYLADVVFGHEEVLLAAGTRRDKNVLRDLGWPEAALARHLADELGPGFEAGAREDVLGCPENDWCQNVAGIPLYVPTLVGFSGDGALMTVTVYEPSDSKPHFRYLRLERSSEGWSVTTNGISTVHRQRGVSES